MYSCPLQGRAVFFAQSRRTRNAVEQRDHQFARAQTHGGRVEFVNWTDFEVRR